MLRVFRSLDEYETCGVPGEFCFHIAVSGQEGSSQVPSYVNNFSYRLKALEPDEFLVSSLEKGDSSETTDLVKRWLDRRESRVALYSLSFYDSADLILMALPEVYEKVLLEVLQGAEIYNKGGEVS